MKKIRIVLLLLILTVAAGCGNNAESNKVNKQVISGNNVQKADSRSENPKVVKKVEHDVLGYGEMQTIALYVYKDAYEAPLSWSITVDGKEMLNLGRDDYDNADIGFKDVDNDKYDEILVTRRSGGSAGAIGLNIYKPAAGNWKELFAAKNVFDLPSKRFEMKYTGNYKVRFADKETGLKAMIPLVKERYKGSENLLPKIYSWVDPISDIELKDIDGDGEMEILTTQRVIGISHPDTIALFKTMYKKQNQTYRAVTASLIDVSGRLLAQEKLSAWQLNNYIKENEALSANYILPLTDKEMSTYREFSQTKSDQVLSNLSAIEICRLYFHAVKSNDFSTQYALYVQGKQYPTPSYKQFLKDIKSIPVINKIKV